jgi:uncharacterized protein YcbK (DUF882 family)
MTRREALKIVVVTSLAPSLIPSFIDTTPAACLKSLCSGKLAIVNVHTNEKLQVRYMQKEGKFDRKALSKLNYLFRCCYEDLTHRIDPGLYVLLDAVRSKLNANERIFHLLSGYRSPAYNNYLKESGLGVAKDSYHTKGMAADVLIEGVSLQDLRKTAAAFKVGGVGAYSGFVHVDIGPVRYWEG